MKMLLTALVPAMVVLSVVFVIEIRSSGPSGYRIADDVNAVQRLAELVASAGSDLPLAEDGGIDVFRLVRAANDDPDSWTALTRSARFDLGPTRDEIETGDYSRFPYERWKGPLPEETVPVIWDRKPDSEGMRVVGFSDGTADMFDPREWEGVRPR